MYNNIVVGYDESTYSKAALQEAANWIKAHGGKASLVHGVYFDQEESGIAPEQVEKRMEFGKKVCLQAKDVMSKEYGIEIESLICEGEPPQVIVDVARAKGADLIALGTHGRRGIKRLIMGSVTSQVIVSSSCDVLVVKRPCGGCGGKYKSALVPFDGSQSSRNALGRALEIAKADGTGVTALYVMPRYEEMMEFFMTEGMKNSMYQEAQKVLNAAKAAASAQGLPITTMVDEGAVSEKIVYLADKLWCDLIVMGSHGWTGINKAIIGSTAERVITGANCPVLIVR